VLTQPWFEDELLQPGSEDGIGANGIAFRNGDLYVAVADGGLIVRVSVSRSGSPGRLRVIAQREELKSVDGIAFDLLGNLWLVTNGPESGRLAVLTSFGALFVLADQPEWLDYPTQPVFGTTPGTLGSLYISNGAIESGAPNVIAFGGPLRVP
jgi:sugar lactone lactonase YvrE